MLRLIESETPVLEGNTYHYFMATLWQLDPFNIANRAIAGGVYRYWVYDNGDELPFDHEFSTFKPKIGNNWPLDRIMFVLGSCNQMTSFA